MNATEMVLTTAPFVVRREVRWGDCDPAGVVYTGRFPDYVLGAVALYTGHLGEGCRLGDAHGVGTPCRAMSFDFVGTLWPGDLIFIECRLGALRTRSFDIELEARRPDGSAVSSAVFFTYLRASGRADRDTGSGVASGRAACPRRMRNPHP